MKILLIGPQGSGKSTQGKLLANSLQIPYISTGESFRKIASENTDEGRRIKQIIESGNLVDDQTTAELLAKRIQADDCQNGFILDGYPRNVEQARKIADLNFDKVIYLNIADQVVLERLLKRGRVDDTASSIKTRLDLYYQQTQSLIDYYKNQGLLVEIDATVNIQTVQDAIKKSL